jgi:hypothetical protein
MQQLYTWMRSTFEESWDPIWSAATRPERVKLLRSACLSAADARIRAEVEELDEEFWGSVLDTLEAEIMIIMQGLTDPQGAWEDLAAFRGQDAVSDAMAAGLTDSLSAEALRLYRPRLRKWIATKPRHSRWVLHTKRDQ